MLRNSLLTIPVQNQSNQQTYIEVFPFDTPLQLAYRYCTQQSLEFNYISPLSKSIIQYIQRLLESQSLDQVLSSTVRVHFDKFINNPSIRESMKDINNTIEVAQGGIMIRESQTTVKQSNLQEYCDNFDFSFEGERNSVSPLKEFTFKGKLQNYLNPKEVKSQHTSRNQSFASAKVEHYLKQNSICKIEALQKYDQMSNKVIGRMKRLSPQKHQSKVPYMDYIKKRQPSVVKTREQQSQQSSPWKTTNIPTTMQTLPKGRTSCKNKELLQITSSNELSSSQIKNNNEQSVNQSLVSNGTVMNTKSRIDRTNSFKSMINKLEMIGTPQKSAAKVDVYLKCQNVTYAKIEQKINELFVLLDSNKDGFIDHTIDLQIVMQHIVDMFEPVWFQILVKKQQISKGQFQQMMQKRVKDIEQLEIRRFLFNTVRK